MSKEQTEKPAFKAPETKQEKLKAINLLGKKLDKDFKTKGTFQLFGAKVGQRIPSRPTGLPSIDNKLFGCGGLPKGRIIEIFGLESSGKTALVCQFIGETQKAGGVAAFVDAEHALDPTFAAMLGVNMDELVISQPNCGEEALDTVIALVEAQAADIIVVDSVAALVPRAELDGEMGDSHMGLHARLMSQAMRKLVGIVSKSHTTVIFINQIRSKVGVVFGNPEVTTGGFGLRFAATTRIEVRKVSNTEKGPIKDGDVVIGHWMNLKGVKNKAGAPFKETRVALYYDTGFDTAHDTIEHAIEIGVIVGAVKFTFANDAKGEKFTREELADKLSELRAAITNYYNELAIQAKIAIGGLETEEIDEETEE